MLEFVVPISLAVGLGLGYILGDELSKRETPGPPIIPLTTPCPGCGHRECTLKFFTPTQKPEDSRIERTCQVCGCKVTQGPVAGAEWFKKK